MGMKGAGRNKIRGGRIPTAPSLLVSCFLPCPKARLGKPGGFFREGQRCTRKLPIAPKTAKAEAPQLGFGVCPAQRVCMVMSMWYPRDELWEGCPCKDVGCLC